jgi:hypothetical protein
MKFITSSVETSEPGKEIGMIAIVCMYVHAHVRERESKVFFGAHAVIRATF